MNIEQSLKYNTLLQDCVQSITGLNYKYADISRIEDKIINMYNLCVRLRKSPVIKLSKPSKANFKARERWNTAKTDMIGNIKLKIAAGYYTVDEFLADPSAYIDSKIVGNMANNPVFVKSISKYFSDEYINYNLPDEEEIPF